ncbi:hypothetical protein U1Q18_015149 [Sarracenia purpurea var. burkii]
MRTHYTIADVPSSYIDPWLSGNIQADAGVNVAAGSPKNSNKFATLQGHQEDLVPEQTNAKLPNSWTNCITTEIVANVEDSGNNVVHLVRPAEDTQPSSNSAHQTSNKKSSNNKRKKNRSGR